MNQRELNGLIKDSRFYFRKNQIVGSYLQQRKRWANGVSVAPRRNFNEPLSIYYSFIDVS